LELPVLLLLLLPLLLVMAISCVPNVQHEQ
jgi:hypothetical protein